MKKEEAIAKFKNCKFFVESTDKSAAVQKALFSLGFKWNSGDVRVCNLHSPLMVVKDGTIFWSEFPSWEASTELETVRVDEILEACPHGKSRHKRKHAFMDGQKIFSPEYNCIAVYRGTNESGGLLTDTFMFLDGEKLSQIGGEITSGTGYTASYIPATPEQEALLEEQIHNELQKMKEKVSQLASIK